VNVVELWFTEEWMPGLKVSVKVESVVHKEKTRFQDLAVYDTEALGRILVLDDVIQTSEVDEHLYHECMVHVPLMAHPNPEEVLIVGGGDGGSLREVLKHKTVKCATLVDIDEGVIEASKRFLPQWNTGFNDPRAKVVIANGVDFVAQAKEKYDVVIVDSTDPIGPGEALFQEEFYRSIREALRPGGMMTAQTENPILMPDLVRTVFGRIRNVFPVAKIYTGPMPTYPGGFWCYSCGSLGPDPSEPVRGVEGLDFRYYSPEIHRKAFLLAPEVARDIGAS
jgi:spermidine synthase